MVHKDDIKEAITYSLIKKKDLMIQLNYEIKNKSFQIYADYENKFSSLFKKKNDVINFFKNVPNEKIKNIYNFILILDFLHLNNITHKNINLK